eukprot:11111612-Lingulodinium_polyedra.AAC.1
MHPPLTRGAPKPSQLYHKPWKRLPHGWYGEWPFGSAACGPVARGRTTAGTSTARIRSQQTR